MPTVNSTTFWASVGFIATAIGGLFSMQTSHAVEGSHKEHTISSEFDAVQIQVIKISKDIDYITKKVDIIDKELNEVKEDQQVTSSQILDALRSR